MKEMPFGILRDGRRASLYVLTNNHGMEATITDHGATLTSLKVPDRFGESGDVVLGCGKLSDYEQGNAYWGATIGRYANRIAHAAFTLNGQRYNLLRNEGNHYLHGTLSKKKWTATDASARSGEALELIYLSADGEDGFPGNLTVKVAFTVLAHDNTLHVIYRARSDRDTFINLTNHAYFNLAGEGRGNILDHALVIRASRFTPVDADLIPTGELRSVRDTPFDFLTAAPIGARLEANDEQLRFGRGYDHNWMLDRDSTADLFTAAQAFEPRMGRQMDVLTSEPGVQFYAGNQLDGTLIGKSGTAYNRHAGFCLETQHFPNSPNQPTFPSTLLPRGCEYQSVTRYRFSIRS